MATSTCGVWSIRGKISTPSIGFEGISVNYGSHETGHCVYLGSAGTMKVLCDPTCTKMPVTEFFSDADCKTPDTQARKFSGFEAGKFKCGNAGNTSMTGCPAETECSTIPTSGSGARGLFIGMITAFVMAGSLI